MTSEEQNHSLSDDAWDEMYFGLIAELAEKNSSRYETQALKIIKAKSIEVSVNGIEIRFKLSPTGCWFLTSNSAGGFRERSWVRMGWGKSSKIKSLPNFFAKSEAIVLLDLSR